MLEVIDCRLVSKSEFIMNRGFQPKNSLFFILKGEISFKMKDKNEKAGENELVCFPDNIYFEREMPKPLTFYYLRFENPGRAELPFGKIYIENKTRIISSFEYLVKACEIGNDRHKRHFLNDIFAQIEMDALAGGKRSDGTTERAEKFFEEHIKEKISLRDAAGAAGVSVAGLTLHFKKTVGMPPMRYLNNMRIKKAEALLCRTELSIAMIAQECGFDNAYYCCNVFRKHKGIPPSRFRSMYGL